MSSQSVVNKVDVFVIKLIINYNFLRRECNVCMHLNKTYYLEMHFFSFVSSL